MTGRTDVLPRGPDGVVAAGAVAEEGRESPAPARGDENRVNGEGTSWIGGQQGAVGCSRRWVESV